MRASICIVGVAHPIIDSVAISGGWDDPPELRPTLGLEAKYRSDNDLRAVNLRANLPGSMVAGTGVRPITYCHKGACARRSPAWRAARLEYGSRAAAPRKGRQRNIIVDRDLPLFWTRFDGV